MWSSSDLVQTIYKHTLTAFFRGEMVAVICKPSQGSAFRKSSVSNRIWLEMVSVCFSMFPYDSICIYLCVCSMDFHGFLMISEVSWKRATVAPPSACCQYDLWQRLKVGQRPRSTRVHYELLLDRLCRSLSNEVFLGSCTLLPIPAPTSASPQGVWSL